MTDARTTIPSKIYVGIGNRTHGVPPQAMVTAWGTDHAARGRMSTIDSSNVTTATLDNQPLSGFRIGDYFYKEEISIEDPRGFGVYVKTEDILQLLKETQVVNGLITTACVWARCNGNNVLLARDSERYHQAVTVTEIANSKLPWREARVGNWVTLSNGVQGIYLGRYAFLTFHNTGYVDPSDVYSNRLRADQTVRVAVFDPKGTRSHSSQLHLSSSPKLARIDQQTEMDPREAERQLNQLLEDPTCKQIASTWEYQRVMAASKPADFTTLRLEARPLASVDLNDPHCTARLLIELNNGRLGIASSMNRNYHTNVYHINPSALAENRLVFEVDHPTRNPRPVTSVVNLTQVSKFSRLVISVDTSLGNTLQLS